MITKVYNLTQFAEDDKYVVFDGGETSLITYVLWEQDRNHPIQLEITYLNDDVSELLTMTPPTGVMQIGSQDADSPLRIKKLVLQRSNVIEREEFTDEGAVSTLYTVSSDKIGKVLLIGKDNNNNDILKYCSPDLVELTVVGDDGEDQPNKIMAKILIPPATSTEGDETPSIPDNDAETGDLEEGLEDEEIIEDSDNLDNEAKEVEEKEYEDGFYEVIGVLGTFTQALVYDESATTQQTIVSQEENIGGQVSYVVVNKNEMTKIVAEELSDWDYFLNNTKLQLFTIPAGVSFDEMIDKNYVYEYIDLFYTLDTPVPVPGKSEDEGIEITTEDKQLKIDNEIYTASNMWQATIPGKAINPKATITKGKNVRVDAYLRYWINEPREVTK